MCQSPVIRLILNVSLPGSPNAARPSSFDVEPDPAVNDALPGVSSETRGLTESFPSATRREGDGEQESGNCVD